MRDENQHGATLRTFEAVVYNKRLLTNNPFVNEFPYFRADYMKYFNDIGDIRKIHTSFFKEDLTDYCYNDEFSPRNLFDEIENNNVLDDERKL